MDCDHNHERDIIRAVDKANLINQKTMMMIKEYSASDGEFIVIASILENTMKTLISEWQEKYAEIVGKESAEAIIASVRIASQKSEIMVKRK